ncbi:phosphoglycolate phosphatase [Colwellia sp. E2M01]|uniref:phosphoglycolate phosphatase n=1 Tax=Colwellia sp. E2M01 TaxID=2841561 RepID=UPI001C093BC9|nr:phosphoglycolate phosphatase [Colwellia sp. E2M01]MBU2869498.1 phosphoglycolate phosphatase [Colwellia sp. E2M01]
MTIPNKQVLLFDLDGTLVDSAPDLAAALNKTLSDLGKPEFAQDTIRSWVGNGAQTLVARGLSGSATIDSQLDSELAQRAVTLFLDHYREQMCVETVLYPDVKEGLVALKSAGFRLGIITNKPVEFIQPILSGLGIDRLFEIIIGADTLAEKKPHPAQLFYAVEQLNVVTENCLMIGDSKNDILAAQAASMDSVGLTYGYNYGEDIANYNPQWCFDTFAEFTAALQN